MGQLSALALAVALALVGVACGRELLGDVLPPVDIALNSTVGQVRGRAAGRPVTNVAGGALT